jgi:hypothetical protein
MYTPSTAGYMFLAWYYPRSNNSSFDGKLQLAPQTEKMALFALEDASADLVRK